MNFFVAEKTTASTGEIIPLQFFYQQVYAGATTSTKTRLDALRKKIPLEWQARIAQRVPWLNPYRKPWGLKEKQKLG